MSDKTVAFLFPGQGSQAVGMGRELADNFSVAREVFQEADEALGFSLSALCFEGPEDRLQLTEFTQPAIVTVSVAAERVLRVHGIAPTIVAGHSLGEYTALVAAGVLSFGDAVRAVHARGQYMQQAVPAGEGAMAAVLGLSSGAVVDVCVAAGAETGAVVAAANLNAPEQTVISGAAAGVARAGELAKVAGAKRVVMLQVSAPFHCALMQPAQDRLAALLAGFEFREARVPVVVNVDAVAVREGAKLREALVRQVTGAVRWVESMQVVLAAGAVLAVEVGPGKVLSGLMRQMDRGQAMFHVEDAVSLAKVLEAVGG